VFLVPPAGLPRASLQAGFIRLLGFDGGFADLTVIVLFCYKVASRLLIAFCCRPERMLRQEASDLWLESALRRTLRITGTVLAVDQKTLSSFT